LDWVVDPANDLWDFELHLGFLCSKQVAGVVAGGSDENIGVINVGADEVIIIGAISDYRFTAKTRAEEPETVLVDIHYSDLVALCVKDSP